MAPFPMTLWIAISDRDVQNHIHEVQEFQRESEENCSRMGFDIRSTNRAATPPHVVLGVESFIGVNGTFCGAQVIVLSSRAT